MCFLNCRALIMYGYAVVEMTLVEYLLMSSSSLWERQMKIEHDDDNMVLMSVKPQSYMILNKGAALDAYAAGNQLPFPASFLQVAPPPPPPRASWMTINEGR